MKTRIFASLTAAKAAEGSILTEAVALADARSFRFPPSLGDQDLQKLLRHNGNFLELVKQRRRELAPDRLNRAAITAHVDPTDPDFQRLLSIADGVPVIRAASFVPNGVPQPIRTKDRMLMEPMNKKIYAN